MKESCTVLEKKVRQDFFPLLPFSLLILFKKKTNKIRDGNLKNGAFISVHIRNIIQQLQSFQFFFIFFFGGGGGGIPHFFLSLSGVIVTHHLQCSVTHLGIWTSNKVVGWGYQFLEHSITRLTDSDTQSWS